MKSESMEQHRKKAPLEIKCGVITLSDSKFKDYQETKSTSTDISGELLVNALQNKYTVESHTIIPDDALLLLSTIKEMIEKKVDIIITTGGTGIGSRDITVETLNPLFEKELDGFGEIFRLESYNELGIGAILSRATAGVYQKTLILALPGSPNAVKLGIKLVVGELGHLVKHLKE